MDFLELMIKREPHLAYPRRLSQKIERLLAVAGDDDGKLSPALDALYHELADVAPAMVEMIRKDYDPRYYRGRVQEYEAAKKAALMEQGGKFERLSGSYADALAEYEQGLIDENAEDTMARYSEEYEAAKSIQNKQERQIAVANLEIEMAKQQQEYVASNEYTRLLSGRERELQKAQQIERLNNLQKHPLLED